MEFCPGCGGLLRETAVGRFDEQDCLVCGGAVLSSTGTESLLMQLHGLSLEALRDDSFEPERPLTCPDCKTRMRALDVKAARTAPDQRPPEKRKWVAPGEVRVDLCFGCGCSFLDRGERALLEPSIDRDDAL